MQTKNKEDIRTILRKTRRELPKEIQQQKSAKIISKIRHSSAFKQVRKVAYYHAVRGEADPAGLVEIASEDTQFYLPILSSDKSQGLVFAPINQDTQYKDNPFAIPEPIVIPEEIINPEALDLVIMPLLGFDDKGSRLGMGGGYYDRCFAFKKNKTKNPILMGFAYDFQEIATIDIEPWDIGLDMVATESKFIVF